MTAIFTERLLSKQNQKCIRRMTCASPFGAPGGLFRAPPRGGGLCYAARKLQIA